MKLRWIKSRTKIFLFTTLDYDDHKLDIHKKLIV